MGRLSSSKGFAVSKIIIAKYARYLLVGLAILALGACATVPTRSSPDNGAIYGYFDIPKDSIGSLDKIAIFRYPIHVKAYLGFATDLQCVIVGDAFFAYDAAPGQYFIQSVVATQSGGLFTSETNNSLELVPLRIGGMTEADKAAMKKALVTVKPGQLLYLGAQGISLEKQAGFLSKGSFSIGPIKSPTEKEVLEKVLPALKGTPWAEPVKERIASLK